MYHLELVPVDVAVVESLGEGGVLGDGLDTGLRVQVHPHVHLAPGRLLNAEGRR